MKELDARGGYRVERGEIAKAQKLERHDSAGLAR
jgi:hypothetical protein